MPASCRPLGCQEPVLCRCALGPPTWAVHGLAYAWATARPLRAREGLTLNL